MIKVTNRNDFDFEAKCAGVMYRFPGKGKTVAAPDEAVAHIFGWADPDKTQYITRHGWAKPNESLEKGIEILNRFAFERIVPKLDVPMASDVHGAAPVVQEPASSEEGTDGSEPGGAGILGSMVSNAAQGDMRSRLGNRVR